MNRSWLTTPQRYDLAGASAPQALAFGAILASLGGEPASLAERATQLWPTRSDEGGRRSASKARRDQGATST
jgi:hypothetical protein